MCPPTTRNHKLVLFVIKPGNRSKRSISRNISSAQKKNEITSEVHHSKWDAGEFEDFDIHSLSAPRPPMQ